MISGAENPVIAVADQLRAQGRRVHQLAVSHAFHSALMDPMIDEFGAVAAGLPIVCSLRGEVLREVLGDARDDRRVGRSDRA